MYVHSTDNYVFSDILFSDVRMNVATVHACGLDNGMLRYFKIFERNLGVLFVKTLI